LYEQALQYTDSQVGRLMQRLDELSRLDNTIIVIVSDHGEEFMERGRWGHREVNLHDEILKVPLIILLPGLAAGQVVQHQVRTLDIMPTLLELSNCPPPKGLMGTSLVPIWTQPVTGNVEEISISERFRNDSHIIAARTESFKYIWDSHQKNHPRLFDLQADPGEREDVSQQFPQVVRRFQSLIDSHLLFAAQSQSTRQTAQIELDDAVIQRLHDLGYIE